MPKDIKEAASLYRKAAEQGLVDAEVRLGQLYYFGTDGVPQDSVEAAKWVAKAAALNNPWAQNTLGSMYENGTGIAPDPKQAALWYQKGATMGDAKAEFNLGRLFESGVGVERDRAKAYLWLTLSADQGEVPAIKMLEDLQVNPKQSELTEGKRLVDEYRKQHPKTATVKSK